MKFITAFMISIVLYIFIGSHVFNTLHKFYVLKSTTLPDLTFTSDRLRYLLHGSLKEDVVRLTSANLKSDSALPNFYIYIDKDDISKLNADLPESGWKQYVSAYLKTDDSNSRRRIELRYRGSSHYHWLYKKKSLRIKLARGDLYNMERKFNLINLPNEFMTNEIVNYEIARENNLLSPDYYPVRVHINGEYAGVYMYLSQVDESLLRKHKRMPGSVYYGEKPNVSENQESLLWKNEIFWAKEASRSIEFEKDRKDIKYFIDAINKKSDVEFYNFVNTYLDKEKFYTFFSLDTYFGRNHHDFFHNNKLYFDPYLGKFEPIAWDLRFWTNYLAKDTSFYSLLARIKLNPVLEYERDRVAYNFLRRTDSDDVIKRYQKYNDLIYNDLSADIYRDTAIYSAPFFSGIALPFYMQEFKNSTTLLATNLKLRQRFLKKIYTNVSAIFDYKLVDNNALMVTFKVTGNNPITVDLTKAFGDKSKNKLKIFRLTPNTLRNENTKNISNGVETLYPGRKYVKGNATGHSVYTLFGSKMLVDSPLYYRFIIYNADLNKNRSAINHMNVTNAITKASYVIKRNQIVIKKWSDSIHPWKLPDTTPTLLTLSGKIEVRKTIEYGDSTKVTINPGTKFKMHPGTSIIFKGRVTALGTKDKPIMFTQKTKGSPWGSIILQGEHTSESQFDHIRVSGGSTSTHNLINYPGQFNVHGSKNFSISNCVLENNTLGDDNMHIAYSSGKISRCQFINSNSDALDVDISDIDIRDSLFLNSGNDAIDFMTTQAVVKNNLVVAAGDKCISTGEWSKGNFDTNILLDCSIGIEVKDKSEVTLKNSLISGSQITAINLYNKNIKYDKGGTLYASNIYVPDKEKIQSDKKSHYEFEHITNKFPNIGDFTIVSTYFPNASTWAEINPAHYIRTH